jgi:hypothetical protein
VTPVIPVIVRGKGGGGGCDSRLSSTSEFHHCDIVGAAIRRLTFWRDGFTVGDGPLMRSDDPANADVPAVIHASQAPPSILNVCAAASLSRCR